jgi:hypothetical protein
MSTPLTDAILAMHEDGALKIVKDRLDAGEARRRSLTTRAWR